MKTQVDILRETLTQEVEKITMSNVSDPVKFWALYSTSFYERLFQKINNKHKLDATYNIMLSKLKRNDAKAALNFFYRLRMEELNGEFKWESKMNEQIRKIIREEIRSILSEKNIKTQKWKQIPRHEWRPAGLSDSTVVKSGNYVTGYVDSGHINPQLRKVVHIQLGHDDNLITKPIKSIQDAEEILYKIEDNKGKMI